MTFLRRLPPSSAIYLPRGKASFEQDELLNGWFVRDIRVIGWAARTLPEEVRNMVPEIPWPKITGMRSVLVHGDFEIGTEIIWNSASRDVPAPKPSIERLLQRLEAQT